MPADTNHFAIISAALFLFLISRPNNICSSGGVMLLKGEKRERENTLMAWLRVPFAGAAGRGERVTPLLCRETPAAHFAQSGACDGCGFVDTT